jgi:hypothetical protein
VGVHIEVGKKEEEPSTAATETDEEMARRLQSEMGDAGDRRDDFLYSTKGPKKAVNFADQVVAMDDYESYDQIDTSVKADGAYSIKGAGEKFKLGGGVGSSNVPSLKK